MTAWEKIVLALIAVTVIVVMALLPTNPKSREIISKPSPVKWSAVKDDPARQMSLRWLGIIANSTAQPGSWIQRNLEKRFNVALDPIFMDPNAYEKRRPLMLCGGDVPDVMWSGDPSQVRANIRNGFVMEIPCEVILAHCPTYVKWLNTFGKEAWLYSRYKGKNYGLPTFMASNSRPRIGGWRMDWLRNVGIEKVPETVEEMHEALYRFRHNDPDGNGAQDTYGWSPAIFHWSLVFSEVFSAYGVLPFDLMERNGKVVWGGMLPETKEALRELHKWYAEDLFHPDFLLYGRNPDTMTFFNGTVGYMYPSEMPADYDVSKEGSLHDRARGFNPAAEFVPAPPLRGRDGRRQGRAWGGAAHVLQFGKQLERQPEKVIRVLEMLEGIVRDETLYMQTRYGERGTHWERDSVKGITTLPPFDKDSRRSSAELLNGNLFFFPCAMDPLYDDLYLSASASEWYGRNRRPEWAMVNIFGKTDILPSGGRYLGDLMNFQMAVFMEMVTGKRDVESFDDFSGEWLRRGGDVLLREANDMSKEMHALYDMVGAGREAP